MMTHEQKRPRWKERVQKVWWHRVSSSVSSHAEREHIQQTNKSPLTPLIRSDAVTHPHKQIISPLRRHLDLNESPKRRWLRHTEVVCPCTVRDRRALMWGSVNSQSLIRALVVTRGEGHTRWSWCMASALCGCVWVCRFPRFTQGLPVVD